MRRSRIISPLLISFLLCGTLLLGGCSVFGLYPVSSRNTPLKSTLPKRTASKLARTLADRLFIEGSLLQMRGEYADAIEKYRKSLRFAPSFGAAHFALARCYRQLHINDSALEHAVIAAESTPENTDARGELAELLVINGEVERGIVEFEEILKKQPADITTRYTVARLLQRRDPDRAIEHYEYIRQYLGDDEDALLNLSELYYNKRDFGHAIDVVGDVIELDPLNSDYLQLMNDLLVESSRFDDALLFIGEVDRRLRPDSVLQRFRVGQLTDMATRIRNGDDDPAESGYARRLSDSSIRRFPESWEIMLRSGFLHYSLDEPAIADSLIARAVTSPNAPARAWLDAASLYLGDGEIERGLTALAPSSARFRNEPDVPYMMGEILYTLHRYDSAERYLRSSLKLREENGEAWGTLGAIYDRQGKVGASSAAYEKALDFSPDNPMLLNNFAFALAERGKQLERALDMMERALDAEPENEAYLDTYGWIYFRMKNYQQALHYIQRSVDIGGASPEVLAHLGDVHAALGNRTEALDAYQQAQKLHPDDPEIRRKIDELK